MSTASTFGEALLRIAPADIYIPPRLGLYFPDKAAALGQLMAIHGQRTPITVRAPTMVTDQDKRGVPHEGKDWVLVTGMHRLNGALIEQLPEVYALERRGIDAADALDEEASENLDRRDQPPLERAIFIHATCEAARARILQMHGDIDQSRIAIKARWDRVKAGEIRVEQALQEESADTSDTMSLVYGWVDSVAEAFGRDKRSIQRSLKLYRLVIEPFPELTQALSDHPVVGNNAAQLKAIADVQDEAHRRAVILQLLGNPELSADEARAVVGINRPGGPDVAPLPHQKHVNAITGGLSRLSATQQKQNLDCIVHALKSDEVKRQLRDRLSEELGE